MENVHSFCYLLFIFTFVGPLFTELSLVENIIYSRAGHIR